MQMPNDLNLTLKGKTMKKNLAILASVLVLASASAPAFAAPCKFCCRVIIECGI